MENKIYLSNICNRRIARHKDRDARNMETTVFHTEKKSLLQYPDKIVFLSGAAQKIGFFLIFSPQKIYKDIVFSSLGKEVNADGIFG